MYRFHISGINQIVESYSPIYTLHSLNPGDYTISISTNLRNGKWSTPVQLLTLSVESPWWKSNYFVSIIILVIVVLSYLYIRNINRKRERKIEWEMKEHKEKKAAMLYDFLDQSRLFKGTVVKEDRSLMNVTFVTGNEELDAKFVKEAKAAGFENLKGHRSVGGMRASIYNAMPIEGVEKLVDFMKKFEAENM